MRIEISQSQQESACKTGVSERRDLTCPYGVPEHFQSLGVANHA